MLSWLGWLGWFEWVEWVEWVLYVLIILVSECMEIAATVDEDPVEFVKQCIKTDFPVKKPVNEEYTKDTQIIAEQADG